MEMSRVPFTLDFLLNEEKSFTLLCHAPAHRMNTLGCAYAHDGAGNHVGGADRQMQHGSSENSDRRIQVSRKAIDRLQLENLAAYSLDDAPAAQGQFIPAMAKAAKAFGANGYFFEVHPNPDKGLSDGPNMLPLDKLENLITELL